MKIEHSKLLRSVSHELTKMNKAELVEFNEALQNNLADLSAGATVKKSVTPQKKFKIKHNAEIFTEAIKMKKGIDIKSHLLFQNDVEITGEQVKNYVQDLKTEKRAFKKAGDRLEAYHNKIILALAESGIKITQKKS